MEDESNIEDDLDNESLSSDNDEEQNTSKKVFKAAKVNPVFYEDKETKKQRREDER